MQLTKEMTMSRQSRRESGFSLIEALVALVVTSFGMLGMIGMQTHLARGADSAKQRTEATRLAQEKMESLRSFTQISVLSGTVSWDGLASGTDTVNNYALAAGVNASTNATFARGWVLGGAITDAMRSVAVTVTWTDRANESQTLTLNSVISKTNPSDSGFLNFPLPQNTTLKRPMNRNLNIPVTATSLGNGKSSLQLAANFAIIFSDISGTVVEKCNQTITSANYASLTGTANCTTYPGYIIAGYVSGSVTPTSGTPTMPTGINTSTLTGWDNSNGKAISCTYGQAKNQSTGAVISDYHYYVCIVPTTASGGTYSGTIRLGGVTTSGNYKVCRFQYDAGTSTANERNVQPYVSVNESLDNQNYYIENSNNDTCPTIESLVTTLHQNCRSSQSPTTAANGACPLATYNTPQ